MIRHICMFTLKEENKEKNIVEFLKKAEVLQSIKGVVGFAAVRNDPKTPKSNYDVALIIDFETVEDLNAYQTSPVHVEFGEFVYTIRRDRACIDYEY